MAKYFSYEPLGDFEYHDTEEAARNAAEDAFAFCEGEAGDGWPQNMEQICWGEVRGRVVLVSEVERPFDEEIVEGFDLFGHDWSNPDIDVLAVYKLETIEPEPLTDKRPIPDHRGAREGFTLPGEYERDA